MTPRCVDLFARQGRCTRTRVSQRGETMQLRRAVGACQRDSTTEPPRSPHATQQTPRGAQTLANRTLRPLGASKSSSDMNLHVLQLFFTSIVSVATHANINFIRIYMRSPTLYFFTPCIGRAVTI
jgi:hypothetical protein